MSIFMLIDGRNGGSTDPDHLGWFEIDSLQLGAGFGVSGGVASAPAFSEATVSMTGVASGLLANLTAGSAIPSIRIQEVDGAGVVAYDLLLGEVLLTGDSLGAGGGTPSTSLSLNYGLIALTTPTGSYGYDLTPGVEINPGLIPQPTVAGPDVLETGEVAQYFLLINDGNVPVSGDSKAWFEISSMQFGAGVGVTNGVLSPPSLSELTVTFAGVSPDLLTRLAGGTSLSSIQVQGVNANGALVYDLRLAQVFVTGDSFSSGGGTPSSSLSLAYDRIGLITAGSSFGYDISDQAAIDPTTLPSLTATGPDYVESAAVTRYFLLIDGVDGGAMNGTSKGWFEISSLQLGAGIGYSPVDGIVGEPSFSELTVTLAGLSPTLLGEIASGDGIDSVRVQGVDGKGAVVYDLRLGDVVLTGDSFSAGGGAPTSSLSFNYGQIGLTTPGRNFGYDIAADSPINPNLIPTPSPAGPDALESGAVEHYFLLIQDGSSSFSKAWFEIDSLQLGAGVGFSNGTSGVPGTPSFSELTVSLTGVSPDLLTRLASATSLPAIQVQGVDGKGAVVYDLRLGDVILTGDSISAGGATPTSSLSFAYDRIGLITASSSFGYDTSDDMAIDPTTLPALTAQGPDAIESGAVTNYFMAVDGFDGGATQSGSQGWFEISSLQLGAGVGYSAGVVSAPTFSEVTVTLTGVSPALLAELATGTGAIGSVQLRGVNGAGEVVYDLRLAEVRVTGDAFSAGGDTPSSSLSFSYERIGLITPGSSFGYDVVNHSPVVAATLPTPTIAGPDVLEAGAVVQYFLRIDGVEGNSTDPDHRGAFQISSLQLGAFQGGQGEPSFSDLVVSMAGVTPGLLAEVGNTTHIASVRVEGVNAAGVVVYDLRLGDVFLTGYAIASGGAALASLSFNYERIGLITASGNFGYDQETELAIDPYSIPLPVFDLPPVVTLLTAEVGENGPSFSQDLLTGASDPNPGTTLVVQDLDASVTTSGGRLLTLGVDYTLTGSTLALTAAGFTRFDGLLTAQTDQAVLHYRVSDGTLNTANTLTLTVNGINDPAVLGSADVTVAETNAPITAAGLLTLVDVDSPAAYVAQPATAGHYGVFSIAGNGSWTYRAHLAYDYLNVGDSLRDTFQVRSTDGGTSSVSVSIAGTPEISTVRLGDAPVAQSGTGGQWAQAWTQTGYVIAHKADYGNAAEAWSAVKFNAVSPQLLSGGDVYGGDLGVSGQSVATSTVRQEIEGREALRISLPASADSVTIKLARLFTNDDGSALSESGVLRLLNASGQVVGEQVFWADAADGTKTVTLGAAAGFVSMELLAGAYNGSGSFVYGGYSSAGGGFGSAIFTDAAGKHGSDFLLDWVEFSVPLAGVPPAGAAIDFGG